MAGHWAGKHLSPEHRAKIGAAQKGRKLSSAQVEQMRMARIGKVMSEEQKAHLSAALRGRKQTPEVIAKRLVTRIYKPHTAEARAKMSAASSARTWSAERHITQRTVQGQVRTPEQRARMSAAQKGLRKPPEYVAKMRERRMTPEQREHLSVAKKAALRDAGVRLENVKRLRTPPLPKGECAYCGGIATTWDHVIPLSRGGAFGRQNLVPACKPCNSSKGTRTPDEWLSAGLIGDRRLLLRSAA